MQDDSSRLAKKIALARAAYGKGALASHGVAKAVRPEDCESSGRWGPAMRR